MKRRDFAKKAGYASALSLAWPLVRCSTPAKPLKLLVLGGTNYLGPAVVKAAQTRGHEITLFNRGITNPDLFPNIEKLRGDRAIESQELSALKNNREWDYVIDTWPSDPRMVESTASLLNGRVKGYAFTSSIAVYADKTQPGITESSPLHQVSAYEPGMSYYQSKVLCEQTVQAFFPQHHFIARPPGIHGPRDESWTLVYWLWRIRNGGPVLAPGDGLDPVQYVDVNDVAHFTIQAITAREEGVFNTIGPRKAPLKWKEFLDRINAYYGDKADLKWVDETFLTEKELRPVVDLPMWEPRTIRAGRHTMSCEKALKAGITFTPMETTFDSALQWYDQVMTPGKDPGLDKRRPFNGITRPRELELLKAWESRKAASAT